MKRINVNLTAVIALLLTVSCNEGKMQMLTVINEDGSCERHINCTKNIPQAERDSLYHGQTDNVAMVSSSHMAGTDSMSFHNEINGDTVTTTYTQAYQSVEDMSVHTPFLISGRPIKSEAKLKKHFRWFYTDYEFTETFTQQWGKLPLPPTKYASEDEVNYWFTGYPDITQGLSGAEAQDILSAIDGKMSKWLNDSMVKIVFACIISHYDSIRNPPVSIEQFVAMRDSLAEYAATQDIIGVDACKLFSDFFHSDAYDPFFDENTPYGKDLNDMLSSYFDFSGFDVLYTLKMPGTVTDTGRGRLSAEGLICYPFNGDRLIPGAYTITATSRVTNVWAYIVSILILPIAIGSWVYKKK